MTDKETIERLGGPAKVAELLGLDKHGGTQRVHNWIARGIPAQVKLDHPEIFLVSGFSGGRPVYDVCAMSADLIRNNSQKAGCIRRSPDSHCCQTRRVVWTCSAHQS